MSQQHINTDIPNSGNGDAYLNKCIYRHIKPNGEVFYIGIGNEKRPYKTYGRSKFWKAIVNKYPDYEIQILKRDLSLQDAIELEKILIDYYGRRDLKTGTLVNQTNGGDGVVNLSQYAKDKIRSASLKMTLSYDELFQLYITENKTMNEIGQLMGLDYTTIKKHLRLFKIKKETILCSINKSKNFNHNARNEQAKKVIDILTGQIYKSIKYAAHEQNIKESTLRHQLLGTYPNKTSLQYL